MAKPAACSSTDSSAALRGRPGARLAFDGLDPAPLVRGLLTGGELLVGLGATALSVAPGEILELKRVIRGISIAAARQALVRAGGRYYHARRDRTGASGSARGDG